MIFCQNLQKLEYVSHKDFNQEQEHFSETLFNEEIFPLLTPLRADTSKNFRFVTNLKLHGAFLLEKILENTSISEVLPEEKNPLVIVQIPKSNVQKNL